MHTDRTVWLNALAYRTEHLQCDYNPDFTSVLTARVRSSTLKLISGVRFTPQCVPRCLGNDLSSRKGTLGGNVPTWTSRWLARNWVGDGSIPAKCPGVPEQDTYILTAPDKLAVAWHGMNG